MKRLSIFLIILIATVTGYAQNPAVYNNLKNKYSQAQYYPGCGGWYFLSYQKDGQTVYGFADKNGNVIAQDAYKYKIHKGFIELYTLNAQKKADHDAWKLEYRQYQQDYNNYKRINAEYDAKKKKL